MELIKTHFFDKNNNNKKLPKKIYVNIKKHSLLWTHLTRQTRILYYEDDKLSMLVEQMGLVPLVYLHYVQLKVELLKTPLPTSVSLG